MTQNDPWAAAAMPQGNPATPTPAAGNIATPPADSLAGAYDTAPPEDSSLLFGAEGSSMPSLFNKTHFMGTERTGIIAKAPYDKHDTDYTTKELKYWNDGKIPDAEGKVKMTTTHATDPRTGKPNRPVMACHVELTTDYRQTLDEWVALERPADDFDPTRDEGNRDFVLSTKLALDAFRDAIKVANANGRAIRGSADLVGKRLTAKRVGKKPNVTGNASWIWEVKITRGLLP